MAFPQPQTPVAPRVPVAPRTAQDWLDELANGREQAYPNISRSEVVSGLRDRLATPTLIDQKNTSLCGPAALMYCLASSKSALYAQYVAELYATGHSTIGRLTVAPGAGCKAYRATAASGIHPVDWVTLASLRDSENDAFDYDAPSCEVGGITMPDDLVDWFKDVGFSKDANVTNLVFTKDEATLTAAGVRRSHSHHVCLFISANMLQSPHESSWTPDHWVVLASPVTVGSGRAKFSVFTWGGVQSVDQPVGDLCENFYGYVSSSAA